MILALAEVENIIDKQGFYLITVRCQQQTSCNSCQSKKSCGTGIVSNAFGNKTHQWRLITTKKIKVGQLVEIGLPNKSLVLSSLLIYLFPLMVMLLATTVASSWLVPFVGGGEMAIIATFFLSGIVAFSVVKPIISRLEHRITNQVSLIRILGESIL